MKLRSVLLSATIAWAGATTRASQSLERRAPPEDQAKDEPAPRAVDVAAQPAAGRDTASPASRRDELTKALAARRQAILKLATAIQEGKRKVEAWEKLQPPDIGMGELQRLRLQAERFRVERQNRKKLQAQTEQLITGVQRYFALRDQLAAVEKEYDNGMQMQQVDQTLRLARDLVRLARAEDEATHRQKKEQADATDEDKISPEEVNEVRRSFHYYEVKEAAPLREVCARPEVYGNARMWPVLMNANRDKLKDPNAEVPVDTVLIVPRLDRMRNIRLGDSQ